MDKLKEFARKWITPDGTSDQVIEECAQDLYDTIMAATDMGRSRHIHRPTTHSQEEEFAEQQRELEREAAETESAMIQRLKVIESLRQGSLPAEYEEELIEEEGQIIEALNESGEKWKPEVGEKLTANFSKPPFAKIESLDLTNLATDEIQPAPGVFVPESEIERLRREVDDAWRESDFYDSYEAVKDFLKAIDKEGGQTS